MLAAALHADEVDNEFVHVIHATQQPHVKGPMHTHEFNRVLVYLDPADIVVTYQDGRRDKQHWKAGQAGWAPAGGMHTSENVGTRPVRVIEVEIKKAAPARVPARNAALDPVALDARHNVLLFENAQVRVFRSWREPGGTEKMHEHPAPGRLAVMLTDLEAQTRTLDGAVAATRASPGYVVWSGAVTHAATNTGSRRFEMIVIEVK
jgi:mannose-6-phosphate isomerase-like protein (cupin superfamily)